MITKRCWMMAENLVSANRICHKMYNSLIGKAPVLKEQQLDNDRKIRKSSHDIDKEG